ncbi:Putative phenylalanine aminotransferase [Corynebacterium occultum]|uniref:Aromatic amino acid aminotransferase n=1 Tax=Corynebacterium occultum TaxID=2675219 RepID=A0A6B8W2H1_9CORY|nr:Putative phenylalanine aminotransferase [Corynebacterium occultum]
MSSLTRADLADIPAYVPGKRLPEALKLSSNEVSTPPLSAAARAMAEAAAGANRYPDMGAVELRTALAEHLELTPEQIAVGCGSSALCQQLVQIAAGPGDEVLFPWRSFEAYPIFASVVGATPVPIPLLEDGRHDLDAMAAAITERTRVIFLCNPNNPSGALMSSAEFEDFMVKVPQNVLVGLDEAYVEYVRSEDTPLATEAITRYPNLIGLRTFSKAYGLAGVRVGYAFGSAELIATLNKVAIPFAVNSVAQAGAIASLAAADELLERTEIIVQERDRVAAATGARHSEANFIWLPTANAAPIAAALSQEQVLVRAFPEGLRVTVASPEENEIFLRAWEKLNLSSQL